MAINIQIRIGPGSFVTPVAIGYAHSACINIQADMVTAGINVASAKWE